MASNCKDAKVELRDIRIDRFGCWEDIVVNGLPSGPSVIHLDDGGQPREFSRFLHFSLYGFENDKTYSGGALVFAKEDDVVSLDRQQATRKAGQLRIKRNTQTVRDTEQWLKLAQASTPQVLADRFFLPTEKRSAAKNLQWLATQPDLIKTLLEVDEGQAETETAQQAKDDFIQTQASLTGQRERANELVEQLTAQKERLRDEIDELELEHQDLTNRPVDVPTAVPSPAILANIAEDIRRLQQRIIPVELAMQLSPRWFELKSYTESEEPNANLALMRRALKQYRQAEEDKQVHQETAARLGKQKVNRNPSDSKRWKRELSRLLAKRDWVVEQCDSTTGYSGREKTFEKTADAPDLQLAEQLFRDAERDAAEAQRKLRSFLDTHGTALTELNSQSSQVPSEIANDSLLKIAPLDEQIRELQRRRLWLVQSHQWLLNRQALSSQSRLWITILFVLSILTVFGTQIVVSYAWQLAMAGLGLGGMVAAGALKAAIEKNVSRKLYNSTMRLEHLDQEIEMLRRDLAGLSSVSSEMHQTQADLKVYEESAALANARLETASEFYQQCIVANELSKQEPWLDPHSARFCVKSSDCPHDESFAC